MFKPLDLQTMIPRSLDVQRIQHLQNTRPAMEQQQFFQEQNRLHQEDQKRVAAPATSAEGRKIGDQGPDGSGRQSNMRYRRFYKPTKTDGDDERRAENGTGQHIDVKI